jgi:hypothetical protein
MNKTQQYNYLRTVLLKQQAPFTQKDTGRARAHALQMWYCKKKSSPESEGLVHREERTN